jgi:hypothetical protein
VDVHTRGCSYPWDAEYLACKQWAGTQPKNGVGYRLYDCKQLEDAILKHLKGATSRYATCGSGWYVRTFHANRLYTNKRFNKKRANTEERYALAQAWNAFVDNFSKEPTKWVLRFNKNRREYESRTEFGRKLRLHRSCDEAEIPCAVREEWICPVCQPGDPKMPDEFYEFIKRPSMCKSSWNSSRERLRAPLLVVSNKIWDVCRQICSRLPSIGGWWIPHPPYEVVAPSVLDLSIQDLFHGPPTLPR